MRRLISSMQSLYYRIMIPYWESQFSPYIKDISIGHVNFKFFYGTPQAVEWYDPVKPNALLEYLWVQENLSITGNRILDVGAHHGHYTSFLGILSKGESTITAVDPLPGNIALVKVNTALNGITTNIVEAAVSDTEGTFTFIPRSNGKLFPGVGKHVNCKMLHGIDPDANVIKLDIEGAEFNVLPYQIDTMPKANIWIIEVHSRYGNADALVSEFAKRGFKVHYVDKTLNKVVEYTDASQIKYTTSIFCSRAV